MTAAELDALRALCAAELEARRAGRPNNCDRFEELVAQAIRVRGDPALATAREEALREATKVCDEQYRLMAVCGQGSRADQAAECARLIRALSPPPRQIMCCVTDVRHALSSPPPAQEGGR